MHRQFEPRTLAVVAVVAVVLVLIVAACAGAPPTATQLASPPPPTPLECEAQAFPCTFAEVPEDVRAETERLAAEATNRITAGATNDELVAWLLTESKVAEVEGDPDAVRFRPLGGRGVWIVRRAEPAPVPAALAADAVAQMGILEYGTSLPPRNDAVTGAGRSERRAVVLSPFRWDFGATDDGQAVADRLRELPDYANGVTYAENPTVSSTDVTIDDFRGWQEYQVVHLVSHGFRLCKDAKCRAAVAANELPGATANIWGSAVRGLELEVVAGATPRYFSMLGADFFRDEYPTGLGDTVVFLNGCSTFGPGATDLADAIRGSRGVVLGWSRPVDSDAAHAAALALYEELAGNGRPVTDALERLGALTIDETLGATLTSTGRALGGDLRIRDVVDFQNPAGGGPLIDGTAVQLIGEPDDGAPDSVAWQLRVDGIDAQAASAVVNVTIDGHAAPPIAVSTGTTAGNGSWRLSGTLNLGVDVGVPHHAQFEASLELPEGGQTEDVVATVLVGASEPTPSLEPSMGSVWSGHVTQRLELPFEGVFTVAEADLTFTLNRRNPDLPIFAYELTGGTMMYSVSGMRSDGCTYDLPPTEITITPEMADAAGEFVIDARNSPPTFYGFVHVTGPAVEVMQTCPDPYAYLTGPYSTRATGIFIDVSPDEDRTVVGDRISGTSSDGTRTFDIRRSE